MFRNLVKSYNYSSNRFHFLNKNMIMIMNLITKMEFKKAGYRGNYSIRLGFDA